MESFIEWGYLGLFLASFLGATIIPFSSEIVLSFLILNGYDFKLSLLIATIGNWLGGLSSYYLGRLGRWETLERFFNLKKEKILHLKTKIDKWGSTLAFLCWLPIIGDPIAVSLGFFRINYILVATWMLFGKIFRYIIWSLFTVWGISLI
ncbi:MAG: DedA family protein [Flavobacteriaceae bacterium]|jgi:membrane protein YqaA with SNARE-associated domain|nr:DedA family protein [Flavobacteriaceae bacterium]MBT3753516.1 DedA family protein [Flavobacteriaceae bacterium]MBT4062537.1 DedA family protein [Flavobacteriaceae bacterium]MBT4246522.1 DedA family protein [Flavobacteriaceae bacterium]MBT4415737.1 DedA family protein [Flavobacteriaceae bacterium]